ncbi:uncharacterized protein FFUJ_11060 [Fusarium fujikuroi IMI 58289]|uniref:Fungal N-terminal domain-containing protein n=1 Tax=Gibberella fujikuroi (strain CBS 195.34 / IMI 58289 / NRRL A-6831) TaxID=1279085 RepID=S0EM67_GIBF5|nr:uncharacterized protein FFUJ_11060 [Fusarium fujikuroi IMI 58289]CCT74987.1 uncharacterized protein FFUJ_11060 [Fusarium fujikuroi IMI 58289]SCO57655.1 uncharacterized protein FFMR_14811 [Fusarium fujikuroi]
MADPLSIASGVAGLVSLGLTICSGLHNYFSAVKDRHRDIETASQSLTLLQSNIFIIQTSTLKLGQRHALSANGVNQGLANCESQLMALQQMMLDLTRDEGLSDTKGRWRKQMVVARYPFDQKRLIQLQDQLSKANMTLSTFVQIFNLDVNIGISEDLRILKSSINTNDNFTHNMLHTISRQLENIGPVIQRTDMEVTTISERVQQNCLASSNYVSDAAVKSRYLENHQNEASELGRLISPRCTCSNLAPNSIYRRSSYVNQSWRGLVISKQEHKRERHRPGCIFFSASPWTSKTTFTYLGLRYWVSRMLSITLTREYPAGAYSLSFAIQPCNVVQSSPAFEAIHRLGRSYLYNLWRCEALFGEPWAFKIAMQQYRRFDLRKETSALILKLRTIYASGLASPFDVDASGSNIAYVSLSFYQRLLGLRTSEDTPSLEDVFESICSLLLYMFDAGVPITASNNDKKTILGNLCWPEFLEKLPRLYNFMATLDTSLCVESVAHTDLWPAIADRGSISGILEVWGEYPEIAEAFGFNEIFCAVMQKDKKKLEAVPMDGQLPRGILETDILLFKHLQNRRRRLRDLSLAFLPSGIRDCYGIVFGSLPDATAKLLWEELQTCSIKSKSEEFEINPGLKPFCPGRYSGGLFDEPLALRTCSLAEEFGFKVSDEGGLPPFFARFRQRLVCMMTSNICDMNVLYLDWLLKHDLNQEYLARGFQTSVLHDLGERMGRNHLFTFLREHSTNNQPWKAISLIAKICNSEMQSHLPCPCVSGAYNRPLAWLISGFAKSLPKYFGVLDSIRSMRNFAGRIEKSIIKVDKSYLARCATHIMTIDLLGIRHIGPCPKSSSIWNIRVSADEDEWAELLDEDRLLWKKVDDLDEDFKRQFQCRNQTVADFIGGYYTERMLEVLEEVHESPTSDHRTGLVAAGVALVDLEESSFGLRLYGVTKDEDFYYEDSDSGE